MTFFFNVSCQFTPPLNLRSVIFCLTPDLTGCISLCLPLLSNKNIIIDFLILDLRQRF